jgi:antitoxin component of MazEF toxin-antitoxin module
MQTKAIEVDGQWLVPLPQELLDEVGITDLVEVEVRDGSLVLEPAMRPWSPEEVEALMGRLEEARNDVREGRTLPQEEVFRAARERLAQLLKERGFANGGDSNLP